jgi:hypothetical protein
VRVDLYFSLHYRIGICEKFEVQIYIMAKSVLEFVGVFAFLITHFGGVYISERILLKTVLYSNSIRHGNLRIIVVHSNIKHVRQVLQQVHWLLHI